MNGETVISTSRLSIRPLATTDSQFIFELLNTDGWIKFIGNRNITDGNAALSYIERVLENNTVRYFVATKKEDGAPLGIVTFIKRDYLPHHDIGFAFLPTYTGKGYAYEATTAVLKMLITENKLVYIFATTLPENVSSIKLLKKMGLSFEKEIPVEKDMLQLYGAGITQLVL